VSEGGHLPGDLDTLADERLDDGERRVRGQEDARVAVQLVDHILKGRRPLMVTRVIFLWFWITYTSQFVQFGLHNDMRINWNALKCFH